MLIYRKGGKYMREDRVGTLRLSGDEALDFVTSFLHPSAEEIAQYGVMRKRRDDNISINRNSKGFEADIAGLDLSFLDEDIKEEQVSITVTMAIGIPTEYYCSTDAVMNHRVIISNSEKDFKKCKTSDLLSIAA